ncbi:hypothetical protein PhCBS80983_g01308 [Powellomyces hirtus]|uniref:D-lactate dehydratase n=1 Tax=Powellomyces hirtus TaxID=109895 RepID=A0A507ECR6_9FUNG|nr:hypothetical protein PhCBS80983_g01308 [Powellomyces hirtus]
MATTAPTTAAPTTAPTTDSTSTIPVGSKGKILVVLSGEDHITLANGKEQPTGYFLPELAKPLQRLLDAGYTPVFTNPNGSTPAEDSMSSYLLVFLGNYMERRREWDLLSRMRETAGLATPRKLSEFNEQELSTFKGIFIPGGHAPMEDLWKNADLGRILNHFHTAGKATGSLCHGPVALLSTRTQGAFTYNGYTLSVYSDQEEKMNELAFGSKLKFKAASELESAGAKLNNTFPMGVKVSVDRELVTGQGFTSAAAFGDAYVKLLEEKA